MNGRAESSLTKAPRGLYAGPPMYKKAFAALALTALAGLLSALPLVSAPAGLRQGDPLVVRLASATGLSAPRVDLIGPSGKRIDGSLAYPEAGSGTGTDPARWRALLAIPVDLAPGLYSLAVSGSELSLGASPAPSPFMVRLNLGVEARSFPEEDIKLDGPNTEIRTVPDPQKTAEAEALFALLARVEPKDAWLRTAFRLPVEGYPRSAGFGDRRLYLYQGGGREASIHGGVDFAVVVGTPVKACAAGRVVFAGTRIVTGTTIVVEHDPGLYSLYMHLSELRAKPGQVLAQGEVLGLSGKTGLATGPHLHWELRIRGQAVDPDYWVAHDPLDK